MFSTKFLDIPPLVSAGGTLVLPGSKSISNRLLLRAAVCDKAAAQLKSTAWAVGRPSRQPNSSWAMLARRYARSPPR
jgi:Flp pilus assembly CpaE family ATPase